MKSQLKTFKPVPPVTVDVDIESSLLQNGFLQRATSSEKEDRSNAIAIQYFADTGKISNMSYSLTATLSKVVSFELHKLRVHQNKNEEVPVIGLVMLAQVPIGMKRTPMKSKKSMKNLWKNGWTYLPSNN